ncbi:MFS transporter, partial [Neobacillus vireti]|uniref:MFS transporter n=1 Tax=Neobacillus vireti TaxID=220686 RepID=UPI003000F69F
MRKINVAQVVDESKFNSLHLGVVAWCAFIMLCDGYDMIVFGSVIPSISVEWGITTSTAGAIGSLAMFGSLIGSLVCGILADFLGRKRVIIFCFIIFSFFTLLTGFAQGPVDFTIYRFIAGLGLGGMPPLLVAITSEYAPKPSRSMLVGLISSGFAIGGIGVALLGIFIIPRFGWEWMFFIGGLPLLAVPFMIKFMPESLAFLVVRKENEKVSSILKRLNPLYIPKKDDSFEVYLPKTGMPVAKLFDERRGFSTIMFWTTSFMALLVIYGLGTWLPQLMVQAGYPLTSSLMFLFALNIGVMVGNISGGLLADRKAPKKVIAGMLILGSISLSLLGLKPGTIILYLLVAIAGACSNGPGTTNYGYASKFYPTHIRSTGVGWTSGMGRIGAMLGPVFGGLLLELSLPTHMNFISFAIPALLGAIAISFIQDKYSDFNMVTIKPVQQFVK